MKILVPYFLVHPLESLSAIGSEQFYVYTGSAPYSESFTADIDLFSIINTGLSANGISDFSNEQYAFDVDKNTYITMPTSSNGYINYSYYTQSSNPDEFSTSKMAMYISTDTLFFNTNQNWRFKYSTNSGSTYTNYTVQEIYGDGTAGPTYCRCNSTSSNAKIFKSIYESNSTVKYKWFNFKVEYPNLREQRFFEMMHGWLIDLPDPIEAYEIQNNYFGSKITTTTFGNTKFSGWHNYNRKTIQLNFEFLTNSQKNLIVKIFELSKGGLPILFIEDEEDKSTWFIGFIKSPLTLSEPIAEAFNIEMQIEEY